MKHYYIYWRGKQVGYYNSSFKQTIKEIEAEGMIVVETALFGRKTSKQRTISCATSL